MKKFILISLVATSLLIFSGCKEKIEQFREDAQTQVKETQEGLKELGQNAKQKAGEVKQTIENVENAANEIKEAKEAVEKVVQ